MTVDDIQAARDHAWKALGAAPLRRAVLGRERCDAIVRVALDEIEAAGRFGGDNAGAAQRIEGRVRRRYAENCGFAFMTLVVAWAISAIVQALVAHWLNQESAP